LFTYLPFCFSQHSLSVCLSAFLFLPTFFVSLFIFFLYSAGCPSFVSCGGWGSWHLSSQEKSYRPHARLKIKILQKINNVSCDFLIKQFAILFFKYFFSSCTFFDINNWFFGFRICVHSWMQTAVDWLMCRSTLFENSIIADQNVLEHFLLRMCINILSILFCDKYVKTFLYIFVGCKLTVVQIIAKLCLPFCAANGQCKAKQ
jgi:hypothetical protein